MTDTLHTPTRLLVVSREPCILRSLCSVGEKNSWHLEIAGSGWEALERIQAGAAPDLLLLEVHPAHTDSLHVLRWLRRLRPDLPIITLSNVSSEQREKEVIRLGARDLLICPCDDKRLESVIRKHMFSQEDPTAKSLTSEDIEQIGSETLFLGTSPVMQKLRAQAELLAQADVPVLILGEPGSGRDTAARLIHRLSVRSGFRFLKISCAALTDDVVEGELLDHALEQCTQGTMFLDEIPKMPISMQKHLLGIMNEKQSTASNPGRPATVDVRILASADVDMERGLADNTFLEDLYYRLSAFAMHVPPLRERKDEIPVLLRHFMHKLARHYSLPSRPISADILRVCQGYTWPGNLRELEAFVKRYLVVGDHNLKLGEPDLFDVQEAAAEVHSFPLRDIKCEAEKNAISAALDRTGWNRKAAARLLKVSYRSMLYKIEQYHLRRYPACGPRLDGVSEIKRNEQLLHKLRPVD